MKDDSTKLGDLPSILQTCDAIKNNGLGLYFSAIYLLKHLQHLSAIFPIADD
jgi:hypothetical protein